MQNVFSASGNISPASCNSWAAISAREFYDGELEVEARDKGDFRFEKSLCYPVALTRLSSSHCNLGYRRGWPHIRANKVGFRTIWFVRKGTLRIVRSHGNCDVKAGQVGFIDSSVPFHAKAMCDAQGEYDSFQLMVPGPLFLMHLQEADRLSAPLDLTGAHGKIVEDILDLLIRDGENLTQRAASPLADSLLVALADHLEDQDAKVSRQQRLAAKRLADIENYILMNLADPELSFERVADNCGISPRYLCYILKANKTSFSKLLWENRLEKARELLLSPAARDYPIHEIAFMSGFKSAAHFSRMFKSAFNLSPRKFRANGETSVRAADHDEIQRFGRAGLPPHGNA